MRIVSVLPSATEIVAALGRGSDLVGRSEECDFPPAVRSLPVVMRARTLDANRPSAEIDQRVQSTRASGESLYHLDVDLLRALRPDLLLTQNLCGVCSVTEEEVRTACASAGVAPHIVSLSPTTLGGVWDSIDEVGRAIGASESALRRTTVLRERSRRNETSGSGAIRVAVIEWLDPPILAGLWVPEMVDAAGGVAIGVEAGHEGVRTTWEQIGQEGPELVVLSPCSFSVERTLAELQNPDLRNRLSELHPSGGTWIADEAYFSRPGPRLLEGIELIRSLVAGSDPSGAPMPVVEWIALSSPESVA